MKDLFEQFGEALKPEIVDIYELSELKVKSWRHTDKRPCPKCGNKLQAPYKCAKCKVQLRVTMQF